MKNNTKYLHISEFIAKIAVESNFTLIINRAPHGWGSVTEFLQTKPVQ